jgi:outer membrane protein assembly factor BamA
LNENVIDRTIALISLGEDDAVMTYPTLSLAPGTGTRTGMTLRHNALFGRPQEKLVAYLMVYVNGDMRFRTYATSANLLGTDWSLKGSASIKRQKNYSINQPGTSKFWYYSDSSEYYMGQLSHPLPWGFVGRGAGYLKRYRLGKAPPQEDELVSDFFVNDQGEIDPGMRGLDQNFWDRTSQFTLERDTRNNPHITLAGSKLETNWRYHWTDIGHDFHEGEITFTKYFKLGSERYEITRAEEKREGGVTLKRVLQQMELEKIRTTIFNRKVVVLRGYAARTWEIHGNTMPVYGLQTLGSETPMRGYAGPRFRDRAVTALSMEYRFPMMRLVDGVIFNEYGVIGPDFSTAFDTERIKNSWGFGLHVRRPDIFLFRSELGFHGLKGAVLTISVNAAY